MSEKVNLHYLCPDKTILDNFNPLRLFSMYMPYADMFLYGFDIEKC